MARYVSTLELAQFFNNLETCPLQKDYHAANGPENERRSHVFDQGANMVAEWLGDKGLDCFGHKSQQWRWYIQQEGALNTAFYPYLRPWHEWDKEDVCRIVHMYAVDDQDRDYLIGQLPSYTSILGFFIHNITKESVIPCMLNEWMENPKEDHTVPEYRELSKGYVKQLNPYGFMIMQDEYVCLDTPYARIQDYQEKDVDKVFNWNPLRRSVLKTEHDPELMYDLGWVLEEIK